MGVFNTDQGSQFTSFNFTGALKDAGIRISMDKVHVHVGNIPMKNALLEINRPNQPGRQKRLGT